MKKLFVLILSVVAFMACQSCSNNPVSLFGANDGGSKSNKSSGGSVAIDSDNEDFLEMLKVRARYGRLFESVMEAFDTGGEIFDDYIWGDEIYMTMSFSNLNDQLAFDLTGNGESEMY